MGKRIVVIGASLSGINALRELVQRLPADFPAPVLITQHIAAHSPGLLPTILGNAGPLPALHPKCMEPLKPGHIYVAPPDRHMLVNRQCVYLSHGPRENLVRPAIDPLFRSAAEAFGPAVIGVVLTGQLDDGTAGLLAIKDRGGTAIVQDPFEATAPSMPMAALRSVHVDRCCTLADMALLLVELARDAPSAKPSKRFARLTHVENRIASGIFEDRDWRILERMSTPSGLNCPVCRSALYELADRRVLRFRCRAGHAFSALSLLGGQAEAREAQLSSIFGALIEEATLTRRMLRSEPYYKDPKLSRGLSCRVKSIQDEADSVSEWLRQMTGLVEPNPAPMVNRRKRRQPLLQS